MTTHSTFGRGASRTACPIHLLNVKPGRMYGTQAMRSPYSLRAQFSPSAEQARLMTGSGGGGSGWAAGMEAGRMYGPQAMRSPYSLRAQFSPSAEQARLMTASG